VTPSPSPAKVPSIPTVLWIMPYSPNCARPSSRAVMTEAAKFEPCDMTAPMRDHTAPLAKRPRRESAPHNSVLALVTPSHDLISVGIKINFQMVDVAVPMSQRGPELFCATKCCRRSKSTRKLTRLRVVIASDPRFQSLSAAL
jgi:hypothetical protein